MKIRSLPNSFVEAGIKLQDPARVLGKHFPDFMIIGPQRTGTTWLSDFLRRHPNALVSQPKEPHYFDNLIEKVTYREVPQDFLWYLNLFDVSRMEKFRLLRHLLRGRTSSLKLLRGEATASSAVGLPVETIRFIYEMNPEVRIICGARHPVDRFWSHLKLIYTDHQGRKLEDVSIQEMLAMCDDPYVVNCGMINRYVDKWLSVIPEAQFHLLRYSGLEDDAEGTFRTAVQFLGLPEPSATLMRQLSSRGKVNATISTKVPAELRAKLDQIYRPEIERLTASGGIGF